MKQSELATTTGLSQKSISNYETGKTNPDSYAIIKLAAFFNVTTDYLLGVTKNNYKNITAIAEKLDETGDTLKELSELLKKMK